MLTELCWSPDNLRVFVDEWRRNPNRPGDDYIGDNPFDRFAATQEATSWSGFLDWSNRLSDRWCFRGQRESEWTLHSSLDRAVKREFSSSDGRYTTQGYYHVDRPLATRSLLSHFRRHWRGPDRTILSRQDHFSWLALMQHSGTPTPFLDWTYCPLVALYFAFEKDPQGDRAAVWAIDFEWLDNKSRGFLRDDATSDYRDSLFGQSTPVIVRVEPLNANRRMIAQKGILLCKLLQEATFAQLLMSMIIHPDTPDRAVIRKLEVPRGCRIEFLARLRAVGICRESLFPALDR
jgi:FRG domain